MQSSSTLGFVLRTRLYGRAMASLFFAGLGISIAIPQLSLFLVQNLHASLPVAGLFFLTNLAAPVLGFVVGSWSDRLTDRLSLCRVGAVAGLVGWVGMAFTTEVWMAFVVNLTVLGFARAAKRRSVTFCWRRATLRKRSQSTGPGSRSPRR